MTLQIQKQSPIGVLQKLCSANMQQIYRRTCESVISLKLRTNLIEITLPYGCSPVNLLHICRTAVLTNTYGVLLLQIFIQHACHIFQYKFVSNLGCFLIYFWLVQCSIQNEQSLVFRNFLCSLSGSFHVNGIL